MNCDFPKKLAAERKKRGISQKQAASALGVSQALLSHYEKGIRECSLDFVVKVSQYYGVSCDYLLGLNSENQENEDVLRVMSTLLSAISKTGGTKSEKFCKTYIDLAIYRILRILTDASHDTTYQTDRMADGYMQLCIARLMKNFEGDKKDLEELLKSSANWNAIANTISSSEKLLNELNFENK